MSLWRHTVRGVRALLNRPAADRDIGDEVEHYFAEAAAELEKTGLSPEEARRAARLELGNVVAVREQVRAYGWENAVETTAADFRHGFRQLVRRPAFSIIAVLTLGLGIGASTMIFSVANPILFEALPYPDAQRLMMIWDGQNGGRSDVTFGTYREVVTRARTFQLLAAVGPFQPTLTNAAEPERLDGQRVSADYFRVLGVTPALGRDFQAADDRPGAPAIAVISDSVWRRRFGADPSIVGRQVQFEGGLAVTVIGVMPATFENVLSPSAEIWWPLQYDDTLPTNGREWGHHLHMIGRLRKGVSEEQARQELQAIARTRANEFSRPPWAALPDGFVMTRLQQDLASMVRPALLAILGAVALLLTIACVNVTNLVLARGFERRTELMVRAALGASRLRLMRQLTAETVLLAIVGGIVGIALASFAVDLVVALSPHELPRAAAIRVDGRVIVFATILTTVIGLAVGVVPALYGSRADLRVDGRAPNDSHGREAGRRTLVVVQLAFALVLLAGAGLLLRSLQHVLAMPAGFNPTNVLTLQVQTVGRRFLDANAAHQFYSAVLEAVRHVPGVTMAGFTSQLPLSGDQDVWGVQVENAPPSAINATRDTYRYAVAPGYFEAMGIPLRRGRLLNTRDDANAPRVVVISESVARRRLPGIDAIGQRLRIGGSPGWFTVVGIVGDVRQESLAIDPLDAVYVTNEQWTQFADRTRWLVVRGPADPRALTPAIRAAIESADKGQLMLRVATMSERVNASAAARRFALVLFQAFGIVALVLASIGTYGLLSGNVTRRLREIAVRAVLGADRRSILALVLREGVSLTVGGILIGLGLAILASRFIETMLFGVSRLDVATYISVVALLALTSTVACWMPAWRASRLDPNVVLRAG
jgi:putative ABC transport system permease protein